MTATRNPKEATLFVSQDDVGRKLHDLMLAQVPGEVQTFTLPLTVEVKSLEPVTVKDLRAWLDKALQIGLNATHGTGPVANSMVTLCVNLDQIKKESKPRPLTSQTAPPDDQQIEGDYLALVPDRPRHSHREESHATAHVHDRHAGPDVVAEDLLG